VRNSDHSVFEKGRQASLTIKWQSLLRGRFCCLEFVKNMKQHFLQSSMRCVTAPSVSAHYSEKALFSLKVIIHSFTCITFTRICTLCTSHIMTLFGARPKSRPHKDASKKPSSYLTSFYIDVSACAVRNWRMWWRCWLRHWTPSRKVTGRHPMGPFGFFMDIILPAALWLCHWLSL
jgi:hypothetical protein